MKNIKNKMQKGFSLVELMVVIAIIAILAAVAIPMYSNYTTRANLGTKLAELGAVKTQVAEDVAGNNGTLTGVNYTAGAAGMPSGATVADGVITMSTVDVVAGTALTLTPTIGSGSITWACGHTGTLTSSQLPNGCS